MTDKQSYVSPLLLITECSTQDVIRTSDGNVSGSGDNYFEWSWGKGVNEEGDF